MSNFQVNISVIIKGSGIWCGYTTIQVWPALARATATFAKFCAVSIMVTSCTPRVLDQPVPEIAQEFPAPSSPSIC